MVQNRINTVVRRISVPYRITVHRTVYRSGTSLDLMQSIWTARIGQIVYYTVDDRKFGDFPANNTVYTPYI